MFTAKVFKNGKLIFSRIYEKKDLPFSTKRKGPAVIKKLIGMMLVQYLCDEEFTIEKECKVEVLETQKNDYNEASDNSEFSQFTFNELKKGKLE